MKKKMTYKEESIDGKWERFASELSGEPVNEITGSNISLDGDDNITAHMWKAMEKMRDVNEITDVDAGWNRLSARLRNENLIPAEKERPVPGVRTLSWFVRIAASLLIIAGLGIASLYLLKPDGTRMITASSFDQRNVVIDLPDGSRVTLNRESTLTYPSTFDSNTRTVALSGEGYFEVSGNQSWPFRVKAEDAEVEVLGTSFNVNTSNLKEKVEVFVSSGRVLLTAGGDTDGIVLTEGFIGTAASGKTEMVLNSNPNYLSWTNGILQYDSTRLSTVFEDLHRVYGINVSATDETIEESRITTVFNNITEEEIIRVISTTFNLNWRKDGIVYIFSR